MARLSLAITLAFCLFNSITQAANSVFGAYSTPSCESCLDATYQSCPGEYTSRSYATCMCYGDGGTRTAQCLSMCDPGLNEPNNVVATWYGYCVIFFKDVCPEAANYISEDRFNDECSPEAIAAGGVGESENNSGSDGDSSVSATATGNSDSMNPTATANANANATSSGSGSGSGSGTGTGGTNGSAGSSTSEESAQSTSGGTVISVPASGIMAGAGMLFALSMFL